MFTIDVWSDFDCPYCYISKHQLKQELKKLDIPYTLTMLPYQLEPEKFNQPDKTFFDALGLTNDSDKENAKKGIKKIETLGKTVGLSLNLSTTPSINTALAHRLALWAKEVDQRKADDLIEMIFHAHFCLNENIADEKNLIRYAKAVGYDDKDAENALQDEKYTALLEQFLDRSFDEDIELVPHYYLPNKVAFAGIVPLDEMTRRVHLALGK